MTKLYKPAYGCIVTFTRKGGGHVGFVVGKDTRGNLMVLGAGIKGMRSVCRFFIWSSNWFLLAEYMDR
nr:hypothetical protein [Snodgrassella alvi]